MLTYYTPIERPQFKSIGATDQQIEGLERELNISLPYSYKLFLRNFGISGDVTLEGNPNHRTNLTGPVYDIYSIYKINRYLKNNKSKIPIKDNDFVYLAYRANTYEIFSLNVFDIMNADLNCRQLVINESTDWITINLEVNITGHLKDIYPSIF